MQQIMRKNVSTIIICMNEGFTSTKFGMRELLMVSYK